MPKNYSKWSPEEENLLRTLKEQQNEKKQVNWETISEFISEKFKTLKTPKQCRQRYINYLKFGENEALILTWSQEQLDLLVQLYLQHGSSWSTMCQFFRNKSQNSVKNKFNNRIKKTSKILHECEVRITNKPKKNITCQLLLSMLDFVNQIQKLANSSNLTINKESNIFKFRKNLLKLSFGKQEFIEEDICQLVKLIKSINIKLRSFGHFKAKNQRMWKITEKNIEAISRFDKIINQQFYCNISKGNQAPSLETSQMIQIKEYIQKESSIQQLPELDMNMKICFGRTQTLMDQISGIVDYNQQHPQYREYYTFDIFE